MDWLSAKLEITQVSRIISGIRYIFQNILIILRPKRDSLLKKIISGAYRVHAEDFSQSTETQKSLIVSFQRDSHTLFYGIFTLIYLVYGIPDQLSHSSSLFEGIAFDKLVLFFRKQY